ncbi:hypothetical protein NPIL_510781 [Nephila pilipes]|uniref:Uncharacterized protein n=1 Tax=Nephila pilipes TaxID=299642 RepID=A0A8X6U093_NEPPI|nr:hypothetical protein NPIL_510781 [Nephila pilipes]
MEIEKKVTLDIFLKINALSLLDNNYPEPEWIRIYAVGSKMNDTVGAGVRSRLFSQYVPVGKYDSRTAIETTALQHLSESLIVNKIKQITWELIMNGKIVELQRILSHVDKDGNERVDLLAKRGTKFHTEEITI